MQNIKKENIKNHPFLILYVQFLKLGELENLY